MANILPLTELDAVNYILKNMGEIPVSTLTGTLPMDASQAQDTLTDISREVQSRGWYFNTERVTLAVNGSDQVPLPTNTLQVRGVDADRSIKVTNRGDLLYNMTPYLTGNTWTDRSSINVEIVYGLAFTDLPQSARNYITLRASRVFQVRELGDPINSQEDNQDETRALTELWQEQLRAEPLSMMDSNTMKQTLANFPNMEPRVIGSY